MTQKIDVEDGKLEIVIDLYELFSEVPIDERHKIARIITWDKIMEEAVKRLIGTDPDYEESTDKQLAVEVLTKMEKHILSGYKWSILQNLDRLASDLISHEHIYWKMYHDPIYKEFFREWLERNKIESNYTTKFKTYEEFKNFVERKLIEFENKLNLKD